MSVIVYQVYAPRHDPLCKFLHQVHRDSLERGNKMLARSMHIRADSVKLGFVSAFELDSQNEVFPLNADMFVCKLCLVSIYALHLWDSLTNVVIQPVRY